MNEALVEELVLTTLHMRQGRRPGLSFTDADVEAIVDGAEPYAGNKTAMVEYLCDAISDFENRVIGLMAAEALSAWRDVA